MCETPFNILFFLLCISLHPLDPLCTGSNHKDQSCTVHFLSEPIRASNKSRPELSLCAVMVKYWTADNILSLGTSTFTPQHLYVLWYSHCGSHNWSWHCAFERTNKYLMQTNRRQHIYNIYCKETDAKHSVLSIIYLQKRHDKWHNLLTQKIYIFLFIHHNKISCGVINMSMFFNNLFSL